MAKKQISDLTSAESLSDEDVLAIDKDPLGLKLTRSIALGDLKDYILTSQQLSSIQLHTLNNI